MTTSSVPTTTEQAGRRLGVWSLVMVPTAFVSMVVASIVGYGLMQAMGMADTDTFYGRGLGGWLVILLLLVIMCVPQVVGWCSASGRAGSARGQSERSASS